jgi:hypothetical protein
MWNRNELLTYFSEQDTVKNDVIDEINGELEIFPDKKQFKYDRNCIKRENRKQKITLRGYR